MTTVQQLLTSIDNINALDCCNETPLMCGTLSRNADLVRFLLDNGASVDRSNDYRRTALHFAASIHNNDNVLRLLIQRGADVNATDHHQCQPVDIAEGEANLRCLLEAGADPERALVAAAACRLVDIVNELIDGDVNVEACSGGSRWSALMNADLCVFDCVSVAAARVRCRR